MNQASIQNFNENRLEQNSDIFDSMLFIIFKLILTSR
jgi:hypothetical protein